MVTAQQLPRAAIVADVVAAAVAKETAVRVVAAATADQQAISRRPVQAVAVAAAVATRRAVVVRQCMFMLFLVVLEVMASQTAKYTLMLILPSPLPMSVGQMLVPVQGQWLWTNGLTVSNITNLSLSLKRQTLAVNWSLVRERQLGLSMHLWRR
jgi:hypothetical protein